MPIFEEGMQTDMAIGMIPFLGYHHVLMILIAIAIILLCELRHDNVCDQALTRRSIITGRMLLYIATHPRYLPHLAMV